MLAFSASPSWSVSLFPKTYDQQIKQAASHWLPGVPWQFWKAQLYQESRLDPAARSQVGAEGLAQFMPATWAEVSKAMGYGLIDRRTVATAIEGGAYYMSQLRKQWKPNDLEKHRFSVASYNAGAGTIRRAQRACEAAQEWATVATCLPDITGQHAAETIGYVRQIWRWYGMMVVL